MKNWLQNLSKLIENSNLSVFLIAQIVCVFLLSPAYTQSIPEPSPLKANDIETKSDAVLSTPETPKDKRVYQSACPGLLKGLFEGKVLPPLSDGQCGERSPVEVTRVSSLPLSSPVILSCRMAESLSLWASDFRDVAMADLGIGISEISVSTHYHCRRRNNLPDGKISEHGFANALDILGFSSTSGKTYSVEKDWGSISTDQNGGDGNLLPEPNNSLMRLARDRACKYFSTVLGPESDPLHADHFHFDLGCHGSNCTYKICE